MKRTVESVNLQDEIDLLKLINSLWRSKWLVAGITLTFMLLAFIYLYFKKPVYQAKITLTPPIQADLVGLNFGRSYTSELKTISAADAYAVFRGVLTAGSTLQAFYEKKSLKNQLNISVSTISPIAGYCVTATGPSKETAAKAVHHFVNLAQKIALAKLNNTIKRELSQVELHLKKEIKELRELASKQQQDHIKRLQEALHIALQAKLERPLILTDHSAYAYLGNPAYLRGASALAAEIKSLETRSSPDLFNEKLQSLQEQYNSLQKLKENHSQTILARQDGELVFITVDNTPKRFIILSALVGFILGFLLILLGEIKTIKPDTHLATNL